MVSQPGSASEGYVRVRLGSLKAQATVMCRKRGFSLLGPYLRELIARGLREDMMSHPGMYLRLRPEASVYSARSAHVYVPLARGLGGERVWVLSVLPGLPSSLGGGIGYLCDITSGDVNGGLEGRGVMVRVEDVTGA